MNGFLSSNTIQMKAVISFPELLPDIHLKKIKSFVCPDWIDHRHLNIQEKAPFPEAGGVGSFP